MDLCRNLGPLCLSLLAISCTTAPTSLDTERVLSYALLTEGITFDSALDLSEFTQIGTNAAYKNTFSGRLIVRPTATQFNITLDTYGLADSALQTLPLLDVELIQQGNRIVPLEQGPIVNDHPWWEYVLRPGFAWEEVSDNGFSRVALPFALKQRNQDCIHNGLLSFLFNDSGEISQVAMQVSHQTCQYLQFEMHGLAAALYEKEVISKDDAVSAIADLHRSGQLPERPLHKIAADYPGVDHREFGSTEEIDPADMTAYGFIIDGIHYVSACGTPYGDYPYCAEMPLPSYSTAKSMVGGLSLMLAEKRYPGISKTSIASVVPECTDTWDAVTVEHALDMVAGHYESSLPHGDEDAAQSSPFFAAEDHASKIEYACSAYPRKSAPGEHWSYQTWSTYLYGTALNEKLRTFLGDDYDFYDDLLVTTLWRPLGLSKLMLSTRRTYDGARQPFTGFGLTLLRGDVATLSDFLGRLDGRMDGEDVFDRKLFDAIKQRRDDDPGMQAETQLIHYNNGFRTFDVSGLIGCDRPTWLTTLSGYGGINIVLMPNETAYYYFSDGNVHRYMHAVRESHRLRPMCAR